MCLHLVGVQLMDFSLEDFPRVALCAGKRHLEGVRASSPYAASEVACANAASTIGPQFAGVGSGRAASWRTKSTAQR